MPAPKKPRKRARKPRPQVVHSYYGKPLDGALVRSHIVQLFTKRSAWNRAALVKAVDEAHSLAGGLPGKRPTRQAVGEALNSLKIAGIVNNEVLGLWRLVNKPPVLIQHDEQALLDMSHEPMSASDGPIVPTVPPGFTEIGEGEESVSVLYNPNDQELATLKGRDRWECRISRDVNGDLSLFSRPPVTGLVIRCGNAMALEGMMQACFRYMNAETGEVPNEGWLYTSPDAVKKWFTTIQQAWPQL